MLQCLLEEKVRFLLVGAYAVAVYGYPRATKDIDILVRAAPENAANLLRALARFGAPLSGVTESDFSIEGIVFQIGSGPRRIDILTSISGVEFEHAYANKRTVSVEGVDVPVISLDDLIANKRATGRTQDLADVERLLSIPPQTK
jgi:predicted nucleotidyltransferase